MGQGAEAKVAKTAIRKYEGKPPLRWLENLELIRATLWRKIERYG
jgi:hypothetical protein